MFLILGTIAFGIFSIAFSTLFTIAKFTVSAIGRIVYWLYYLVHMFVISLHSVIFLVLIEVMHALDNRKDRRICN